MVSMATLPQWCRGAPVLVGYWKWYGLQPANYGIDKRVVKREHLITHSSNYKAHEHILCFVSPLRPRYVSQNLEKKNVTHIGSRPTLGNFQLRFERDQQVRAVRFCPRQHWSNRQGKHLMYMVVKLSRNSLNIHSAFFDHTITRLSTNECVLIQE